MSNKSKVSIEFLGQPDRNPQTVVLSRVPCPDEWVAIDRHCHSVQTVIHCVRPGRGEPLAIVRVRP